MELSPESSKDEGMILLRQVYRAGQTQSTGVPTPGSTTKAAQAKLAPRRKRVRRALAVIAWLLLLGGISYYLCLPNLDEVSRSLKAIREDPNLTMEQKFEKTREVFSKLTPEQSKQVVQSDMKKIHYQRNAEMHKFLKMSPEEQVAYLKQQEEERKQFHKQLGPLGGNGPKGGGGAGVSRGGGGGPITVGGGVAMKAGSGGVRVMMADGGGGPHIFFGPGIGPPGGPLNPSQMQKTMLDNTSPETRAGMSYQRGLMPLPPK
jgi:hypothetical protein